MSRLFRFQEDESEEYTYNRYQYEQQLLDSFLELALNCNDEEELFNTLEALYYTAFNDGYNTCLQDDIIVKHEILEENKIQY